MKQYSMLLLCRREAADARANENADFVAISVVQVQTRIQQGLMGGKNAELRKAVRPPGLFGRGESFRRIEVSDFCRDLCIKAAGVEMSDILNAALAGNEIGPEALHVVAKRRGNAQPGNNDAPL